VQAIYRLCDGQSLQFDQDMEATGQGEVQSSLFHGLLGGYSFYDRLASCRLLTLRRALRYTRVLRGAGAITPQQMVFGANFR
jgi:hypothetical protein